MEYQVKLLTVFCGLRLSFGQIGPILETNLGKIHGSVMKTENGLEISAFRNIRYTEDLVGELDATVNGLLENQLDLFPEDCPCLNIYTTNTSDRNKPVSIYFYDEANTKKDRLNIEAAVAKYIKENDIIFIAALIIPGPLGRLNSGTKLPKDGEYGFLDQVQALRWVQENIADFDGTSSSISVLSQDLFKRWPELLKRPVIDPPVLLPALIANDNSDIRRVFLV